MSGELYAMIEAQSKRQDEIDALVEYIEEHKAENPNLRLAVIDASRSFYKVPAQAEQSYHVVKMERESND